MFTICAKSMFQIDTMWDYIARMATHILMRRFHTWNGCAIIGSVDRLSKTIQWLAVLFRGGYAEQIAYNERGLCTCDLFTIDPQSWNADSMAVCHTGAKAFLVCFEEITKSRPDGSRGLYQLTASEHREPLTIQNVNKTRPRIHMCSLIRSQRFDWTMVNC